MKINVGRKVAVYFSFLSFLLSDAFFGFILSAVEEDVFSEDDESEDFVSVAEGFESDFAAD